MAILLISPRKRQRMFIRIIAGILILFLSVILLMIFPPQFQNKLQNVPTGVLNDLGPKINFDVVDSKQFMDLEMFYGRQINFEYIARDKNNNQVSGDVSAVSREVARGILESMDYEIISLEEKNIGRNEPFIPYY